MKRLLFGIVILSAALTAEVTRVINISQSEADSLNALTVKVAEAKNALEAANDALWKEQKRVARAHGIDSLISSSNDGCSQAWRWLDSYTHLVSEQYCDRGTVFYGNTFTTSGTLTTTR